MVFLEYNGFNRTLQNVTDISPGACIIELWTEQVEFESSNDRAIYFLTGGTSPCLSVSLEPHTQNGQETLLYTFSFNDKYINDIYPPTDILPSDSDLIAMLNGLL